MKETDRQTAGRETVCAHTGRSLGDGEETGSAHAQARRRPGGRTRLQGGIIKLTTPSISNIKQNKEVKLHPLAQTYAPTKTTVSIYIKNI